MTFKNVVGLSLYDRFFCSESDGVVAGAPAGPGRHLRGDVPHRLPLLQHPLLVHRQLRVIQLCKSA